MPDLDRPITSAGTDAHGPRPARLARRLLGCSLALAALALTAGGAAAPAAPGSALYVGDLGSASLTPVDAATATAGHPIRLGGLLPVAVAVAPSGAVEVVAVGSDERGSPGSLLAIDPATGAVVHRTAVGAAPQGVALAPGGRTAYVLGGIDAATTPATRPVTLTPVDTANGRAGKPIAVGTLPSGMVVSPTRSLVAVLDTSPSGDGAPVGVTLVDTASGKARRIALAARALAFTPDGATAYASAPGLEVVPIDTGSGREGRPVSVAPALPVALTVTPDGKTVEVLGSPDPGLGVGAGGGWTLTSIDAASGKVVRVVRLGAAPAPASATVPGTGELALAPGGRQAVVLLDGSATRPGLLVVVDLATGRAGKPVAVGRGAFGLELAPGGATAWVLDAGSYRGAGSGGNTPGSLVPVATATGRAGRPIAAGLAPGAFALGPAPASGHG